MSTLFFRWFLPLFTVVSVILPAVRPVAVFARTSSDPQGAQWAYDHVGLYRAWDYSIGSRDVVVAVVDNGFDERHPELADNVWRNPGEIAGNGVDDDKNGFIDDVTGWDFTPVDRNRDGRIDDREFAGDNDPNPDPVVAGVMAPDVAITHATAVASIIGGIGDNGRDGAGVAWRVRLMNLRAADNEGTGAVQPIADGIRYAVDNGADVINISMSAPDSANFRGVLQYAFDHGVAVFAAVGNMAQPLALSPSYPACGDDGSPTQWILGVSATDASHHLARFSNRGRTCVDLTAPGVDINGAVSYGTYTYGYGWQGTSFAVPFVSGAAALIKAVRPQWQAPDIYRALLTTVRHTCTDHEGDYSDLFGQGALQIDRALRVATAGPRVGGVANWNRRLTSRQLWALEGEDGSVATYTVVTSTEATSPTEAGAFQFGTLEKISSARSYRRFPCGRYVLTVAPSGKGGKDQVVAVYDHNWKAVARWQVLGTGPVTATLVDTAGAGELLVAVAPTGVSTTVARWYTLQGEPAGVWKIAKPHQGVELATLPTPTGDKLVAAISGKKDATIALYESGTTTAAFVVDTFGNRPQLATGDVDGNGVAEIILVGGTPAATVGYYTPTGDLLLQFTTPASTTPAVGAKKTEWRLATGDYFADGRDQVILYPAAGATQAMVFDGHGDLVDSPHLFLTNLSNRALLWQ